MSELKCGCVYSEKERRFVKYCREHAVKILRARWERALGAAKEEVKRG